MARKRMINPDFWIDEKIGALSRDARLLFIGTWTFADDKGRLHGNPARLRAEIFPYDPELDVAELLKELLDAELLKQYEGNSQQLLWITHFLRHQVVNHATQSILPAHPEDYSSATVAVPEKSVVIHSNSTQSNVPQSNVVQLNPSEEFVGDGSVSDLAKQLLGREMDEKQRCKVKGWLGKYGIPGVKRAFEVALDYPEPLEHPLAFVLKVLNNGAEDRGKTYGTKSVHKLNL